MYTFIMLFIFVVVVPIMGYVLYSLIVSFRWSDKVQAITDEMGLCGTSDVARLRSFHDKYQALEKVLLEKRKGTGRLWKDVYGQAIHRLRIDDHVVVSTIGEREAERDIAACREQHRDNPMEYYVALQVLKHGYSDDDPVVAAVYQRKVRSKAAYTLKTDVLQLAKSGDEAAKQFLVEHLDDEY